MQPDHATQHQVSPASVDRLTETLLDLGGDQEVRVIEALAAVLARGWREDPHKAHCGLSEASAEYALTDAALDPDTLTRRAICQRIARRALRGSLVDPTRGATAMHRIDASPAWSRDRLPIGMFGPFLFYRLTPGRWQAGEFFARSQDQHEISLLD